MATTPLQRFWYYLAQLGWKDKVLSVLSPYQVTDFRALSADQQVELADQLRAEWSARSKKPRGAVIHYLCMMPGYKFKVGETPDYTAIDTWIGSKFNGKRLNQLTLPELNNAVTMVKAWYRKQLNAKQ